MGVGGAMAPGVGGGEYGSDLSNLILAWPPQLVEKEAAHAWIHMMLPPRSLRTWERWARLAWLQRAPESGVADGRPSCTRRYHCGFFTAQFQAKHGRG